MDGNFYNSPDCNNTFTQVSAGQYTCLVPFKSLRSTPFNLVYGSLVTAIFYATNNIGDGEVSQPNVLGSTIQTEPSAVTGLDLDPTLSTITSIYLKWVYLLTL